MIQELKTITPFIDFGFALTEYNAAPGDIIAVWLNTVYNDYDISIMCPGATFVKISNYQYQLTYSDIGDYQVYVNAATKDKKTSLQSNTLTITIE